MKVGNRTVLAVILAMTAVVACSTAPSNELSSLGLDARISSQDALDDGADEDYEALLALLEADPAYADQFCSQLSTSEGGLNEADLDEAPDTGGGSVYAQASNRPTGKKGLWAKFIDWCKGSGRTPAPPPPPPPPPPRKKPENPRPVPPNYHEEPETIIKFCETPRDCSRSAGNRSTCDGLYAKPGDQAYWGGEEAMCRDTLAKLAGCAAQVAAAAYAGCTHYRSRDRFGNETKLWIEDYLFELQLDVWTCRECLIYYFTPNEKSGGPNLGDTP
jgi:hypothetical protein